MTALILPALMIFLGFASMASNQYHTLVLEHLHGFSAQQIGNAVALGASTQILLPWVILLAGKWIRNSDRILRRAYLSLAIFLFIYPHVRGYWPALLCYYGIISSLNVGATLQGISIIAAARPKGDQWVLVLRSMGTLGFAVSCLLSSLLADHIPIWGLYTMFGIFALLAIPTSKISGPVLVPTDQPISIKSAFSKLLEKDVLTLIITLGIANLAINGATSVLSNFIHNDLGGSRGQVSLAWTIATFSEFPLLYGSIFFLKRFGVKGLILTGILCSTVRMGILSQVHSFPSLYGIQVLHGLFYGASLSGIGIYLARRFGPKDMQRIQLMAQSIYGGLAGVLGGKATGIIWDGWGLRSVYLSAFFVMVAVSAWIIFGFKERPTQKPSEPLSSEPE